MQKLTRPVTREIEINGVRLAVTFDQDGLGVRPVGSSGAAVRLSWPAVLGACTGKSDVASALAALGGTASVTKNAAGSKADSPEGLLARLDRWLKKHRKRYAKGLNPGASEEEMSALEKALGRPLPDELRTWLSWHNGQDEDLIGSFYEVFALLSAEQIGEEYRSRQGQGGWDAAWVPLLDDFQGDLVALDTSKPGCPVLEVWRGRKKPDRAAETLQAWLEAFVKDVEAGKYEEDPERGEFHGS